MKCEDCLCWVYNDDGIPYCCANPNYLAPCEEDDEDDEDED